MVFRDRVSAGVSIGIGAGMIILTVAAFGAGIVLGWFGMMVYFACTIHAHR